MNVWDVRLPAGQTASLPQPDGWTTLLLVQAGTVQVNGREVTEGRLVTLSREGSGLTLEAAAGCPCAADGRRAHRRADCRLRPPS